MPLNATKKYLTLHPPTNQMLRIPVPQTNKFYSYHATKTAKSLSHLQPAHTHKKTLKNNNSPLQQPHVTQENDAGSGSLG